MSTLQTTLVGIPVRIQPASTSLVPPDHLEGRFFPDVPWGAPVPDLRTVYVSTDSATILGVMYQVALEYAVHNPGAYLRTQELRDIHALAVIEYNETANTGVPCYECDGPVRIATTDTHEIANLGSAGARLWCSVACMVRTHEREQEADGL